MSDLLPPNATPQERAVSDTLVRLSDVPIRARAVWSPDDCPAGVLPWLAWALSVDDWDPAWSTSQKRQVIRDAFFVHRHKGTLGAVRRALASLGYSVTVTEWFDEPEPADQIPYTVRLDATASNDEDDAPPTFQEVVDVFEASKNIRTHLRESAVVVAPEGTIFAGGAIQYGESLKIGPGSTVYGSGYGAGAVVSGSYIEVTG